MCRRQVCRRWVWVLDGAQWAMSSVYRQQSYHVENNGKVRHKGVVGRITWQQSRSIGHVAGAQQQTSRGRRAAAQITWQLSSTTDHVMKGLALKERGVPKEDMIPAATTFAEAATSVPFPPKHVPSASAVTKGCHERVAGCLV